MTAIGLKARERSRYFADGGGEVFASQGFATALDVAEDIFPRGDSAQQGGVV